MRKQLALVFTIAVLGFFSQAHAEGVISKTVFLDQMDTAFIAAAKKIKNGNVTLTRIRCDPEGIAYCSYRVTDNIELQASGDAIKGPTEMVQFATVGPVKETSLQIMTDLLMIAMEVFDNTLTKDERAGILELITNQVKDKRTSGKISGKKVVFQYGINRSEIGFMVTPR